MRWSLECVGRTPAIALGGEPAKPAFCNGNPPLRQGRDRRCRAADRDGPSGRGADRNRLRTRRRRDQRRGGRANLRRSEEHTSELQSLMRISYAVFCLKKKNTNIRLSQKATNTK